MREEIMTEMLHRIQRSSGQKALTDEDFEVWYREAKDYAALRAPEGVTMTFFVHGKHKDWSKDDNVLMPVLLNDWPPPETMDGRPFGKSGGMKALGKVFKKQFPDHMPVLVVNIAEAWMSQQPKGKKMPKNFAPSEDPNRVEVVIAHACSMDQRQAQSMRPILRDKDGAFTGLGKESEIMYDPNKATHPLRDGPVDYLTLYFFIGYFGYDETE